MFVKKKKKTPTKKTIKILKKERKKKEYVDIVKKTGVYQMPLSSNIGWLIHSAATS